MKEVIKKKLHQIEEEYGIKILYSCESGSRAWGFPSPDSDYDVRFIYTRQFEDYLTIHPKKDHLSFPINDELDIYGWDISKVLQLITKSNTTPFEWLQSPVIYREDKIFREELWQLCQSYFCPRSNIHHYLGVARGAMETMQEEEIKIKKLFYVLRPLLAALWCAERDTIAPMSIFPLLDLLSDNLRRKVLTQIRKARGYKKKVVNPIEKNRKTVLDFCYIMDNYQSVSVKEWLDKKSYIQELCGLSSIPHAKGMYALFYDTESKYGYHGIAVKNTANEVSLSSIPKGEQAVAYLFWNMEAYSLYCKEYKEYWDWVEERNDNRYQTNLNHGKNYDSKNMMHKGELRMDDNEPFLPNDYYNLTKEAFSFYYTSRSDEQQVVDIYFFDNSGNSSVLSFQFNADSSKEEEL